MSTTTPFDHFRGTVVPEWIDYNGHMNVAYYLLAFDQATDVFFDSFGLGAAYSESGGGTTFAGEVKISYLRELKQGDPLRVTTQLLAFDEKRLRFYHRMYHDTAGHLAATAEMLSLHIDLSLRRVAPFPPRIQDRLARLWQKHQHLDAPQDAGRGIARPPLASSDAAGPGSKARGA